MSPTSSQRQVYRTPTLSQNQTTLLQGTTSPLWNVANLLKEALLPTHEIDVSRLLIACSALEAHMRAVGQILAARDFQQNIEKIKASYHKAPSAERGTLQELLAYEKSNNCHARRLKEDSAAMGLLWIRRNLSYQYKMYLYMMVEGMDPHAACIKAYQSELEPHFNFVLKKMMMFGVKTSVPVSMSRHEMLAKLHGFAPSSTTNKEERAAAIDSTMSLLRALKPLLHKWEQVFLDLGLEE